MASHTVSKNDLETTLYNVSVLLYAVEEVLIHAGKDLPSMVEVKKALEHLKDELAKAALPAAITYDAPEPANTLLLGDPAQRLRKNVCNP
jgi:hypothetical protein